MSIIIDKTKCAGCKKCLFVCPGSLIKFGEDKKAYMKYPRDCWGCASCVKECRYGAISLYLGADIGGAGGKLTVNDNGDDICWKIERNNGETVEIDVNRKDSNKY